MKKLAIICFVFISLSTSLSFAQQKSKIELNDGTIIEGEVSSLSEGTYTINSSSLGQVKVNASKVRNISTFNNESSQSGNLQKSPNINASKAEIEAIKTKVLSNPEAMQSVTELVKDPQFQQLLNDPKIVNAAKSGNIQELMSNDKLKNFVDNPKLKEIQSKIDEQDK